ncbi:hypothetical protein L2X98_29710 [Microbacterium elymi]|uniref:Uncharacterized protein n=1 Tax=Microbacterium elymi TaxID=2909587 RepID=A0ABY5NHK1_9MICO|nr:hypothetical protein [Microbacterium elymi]UUT34663.1 hypothetical protein L2X98_29710 [Microbacterium elymi]
MPTGDRRELHQERLDDQPDGEGTEREEMSLGAQQWQADDVCDPHPECNRDHPGERCRHAESGLQNNRGVRADCVEGGLSERDLSGESQYQGEPQREDPPDCYILDQPHLVRARDDRGQRGTMTLPISSAQNNPRDEPCWGARGSSPCVRRVVVVMRVPRSDGRAPA